MCETCLRALLVRRWQKRVGLFLAVVVTGWIMVVACLRPLTQSLCQCRPLEPPPPKVLFRLVAGYNESVHQVLPNSSVLQAMTWPQLAELYHRYIENIQIVCGRMVHLGSLQNGGWEACDDLTYRAQPPCLIYSFGIKNDLSFGEEAAKYFGCHTHAFDPSSSSSSSSSSRRHGEQRAVNTSFHATGLAHYDGYWTSWRMRKLRTIMDELGHQTREVSILKMDIEEWEWKCLPDMLMTGGLDGVSQLLMELHISLKSQPKRIRYLSALILLRQLYRAGFRIFYTRRNLFCSFKQIFDGSQKTGCHAVHMVRIESVTFTHLDKFH